MKDMWDNDNVRMGIIKQTGLGADASFDDWYDKDADWWGKYGMQHWKDMEMTATGQCLWACKLMATAVTLLAVAAPFTLY